MKRVILFAAIIFTFQNNCFGQKITLNDLTTLCQKKDWENVNQSLLTKGWAYFESEKGSLTNYNIITWSYNKDNYSDKAQAWFYLYTYEGYPNKIVYNVFNKEAYSIIRNSLSTGNFKLTDSSIEDNEIISVYENSNYILKISTSKRSKSDDEWNNSSITAYSISLIKKAGIYDDQNGTKTSYDDDGSLEGEYNLKNGLMHGPFKLYYPNGNIKKTGNFINGKAVGEFCEYDEDGEKAYEYYMLNDKKNGILKAYENSLLTHTTTYVNDIQNGAHCNYYYNSENNLFGKEYGNFSNDLKNGIWNLAHTENGNERILEFKTYSDGVLHGEFQTIDGDSLITGNYTNNSLDGIYKIYFDLNRFINGGIINTNIKELTLITEGYYTDNNKNGQWRYYDIAGSLRYEGEYNNDEQTGVWKYYYGKITNDNDKLTDFSNKLYLTENYLNGELNGKTTRYSYMEETKYPCTENSSDSCINREYLKIHETIYYKNGLLHGPYELLDSIRNIIIKGYYADNYKNGEWIERISLGTTNKSAFIYTKGNYIRDKKNGTWTEYYADNKVLKTENYKNDLLDGEYIVWNKFNRPYEKKLFNAGRLVELVKFDSVGFSQITKYQITESNLNNFRCLKTDYNDSGSETQEYFINGDALIDHNLFEVKFSLALNGNEFHGYKDGEYTQKAKDNRTIVSGRIFKNMKTGTWKYYYFTQNIIKEAEYNNDIQIKETFYDLNGKLFTGEFEHLRKNEGVNEIIKIKNGARNGKTKYIDLKNNKIIKKENYKNGTLK